MTLSNAQRNSRLDFRRYLYLWERDLLWCAAKYPAWREKAHDLGFTDEKISAPWLHADAGRRIRYMEIAQLV